MTDFRIEPQSGYADSYLDVKFIVRFDAAEESRIELQNLTSGQQLEIVSISKGVIQAGTTAVIKGASSVEGYFNLFNRDKMNQGLGVLPYVDIVCRTSQRSGDKEVKTERTTRFYNESMSLDASVAPFDLIVQNPKLDLASNEPLRIDVVADSEKKYELCIMSADRKRKCTFEVVARPGKTSVVLPSEVIWNDCELRSPGGVDFQVYWVKFEGIDQNRMRNRKYVPLANTQLSFTTRRMMPKPQQRLGPTGQALSEDFVLSDKYFVHTWRHFSSLGNLPMYHSNARQTHMTVLMHEYQSLEPSQYVSVQSTEKQDQPAPKQTIQEMVIERAADNVLQTMLIGAFADIYDKKARVAQNSEYHKAYKQTKSNASASGGGCGCSRNQK